MNNHTENSEQVCFLGEESSPEKQTLGNKVLNASCGLTVLLVGSALLFAGVHRITQIQRTQEALDYLVKVNYPIPVMQSLSEEKMILLANFIEGLEKNPWDDMTIRGITREGDLLVTLDIEVLLEEENPYRKIPLSYMSNYRDGNTHKIKPIEMYEIDSKDIDLNL